MNIADAVYHTVHDYPGGCESLAPRLKTVEGKPMSAGVLRNKANPNSHTNVMGLAEADQIIAVTGDHRILDALEANHGRVGVRVDSDTPASDMAVLELVTHVWCANGDVGKEVERTLADGRVERHEIKRVRAAIYRTQQALNAMLMRLEDMAEPEGHR
ncbi:phage regulatory CII family protein [Denitromonas iodatirespirans]|uniref:Uncharacterized protein n=2 Tax=Rhodocyclales TaxID=206389 RepID=A0A944HD27_DENI1|nr:phage regulatory CII family protein [Denitromonas iodatirespirans]MBT0961691.1 hypothetical protein [Denitromonas iodatirespirans]